MTSPYFLNKTQIDSLFPFYILINKNLKVIALGKSLLKMGVFPKKQNIEQLFSILNPLKPIKLVANLIALQNQSVVLEVFTDKKLKIYGQFEYIEKFEEILFVGSPRFCSTKQAAEHNFFIDDFAKNDPIVAQFDDLHTNEIKNEKHKEFEVKVAEQTHKLETVKDNHEISLYSEQNPDPNIRISCEGDLIYHNPAALYLNFLKYKSKSYPIESFYKLIAAKIDEKKKGWNFEASTSEVDYSFVCVKVSDEGYINIYARDITKQKKYQQKLEKLSLIAQESMNAIIITDNKGKIEWINKAFKEFSGYTINEIKGRTPGAFLQGEKTNLETVVYMRRQIKDDKPFICEVYNYKKGGEAYWVKLKGQPVFDQNGKVINYFAIQENITEAKENQQRIEESEKRHRDVVNNSLAIMMTHTLEGKILSSNPIAEKIFGYSIAEYKDHFILDFLLEKDKPLFKKKYLDVIKAKKIVSGTLRVLNKKGKIVYMLFNNYLMEELGKEPYVIFSAVDISKRILIEKKLIKSKKIAEKLARSKHNFMANISHEIRTPMNAIIGMSRQLQKSILDDEQQDYLNIISIASKNLLTIINDILDLSKLESNKMFFEKIAFSPKVVIENVLKVMDYSAKEKGIQLTNSYCDKQLSPILMGDPQRINQIVLNVISNAIKFTEVGSVDIRCTVLKDNENSQDLEIKIIDTGVGMNLVFLKRIFEKFTQEYETIDNNFRGTGLGMAITKSLVDSMQGNILVKSKVDKGTTIAITFTLEKGKECELDKNTIVLVANNLKGKKILVVDDNIMNRMVANVILKDCEVILSEACNGEEAVNFLKNNKVDLVLMDVQMPILNGYHASEIIRKELKLDVPIIALTANAMKGEKEKCLQFGMSDYLSKPFEEEQFLEIISTWIG